jgi:quinohemoprotein ethanol dehydrogenase
MAAVGLALCAAAALAAAGAPKPGAVDQRRLIAAETNAEWLSYGRTYAEQRYSPLDQINTANVGGLGLAWYHEFDAERGEEATPLIVDGVLYVTTSWSKVFALDARTGAQIWAYDPHVDGAKAFDACCDVVNRGVAVWKGRVYVGALDGRLVALDAATGKPVWSVQTTDPSKPYTITGAPRVVKDKVIIGNGGAEYGVRGYVSAYDAATGALAWRFYVTPNPEGKPDGAASDTVLAAKAAPTWFGDGWKKTGGGGTPWDAIAYDPKLDLLFVGTGNGSPWNHMRRSAGKGDNLFLSSILALKPETGKYVWHYQTTPGESWDYTATQHIMLADLMIGGKKRRVVMQAPKNGFFYVLDAATGRLVSADKFAPVTWAERVDLATGRPVEAPGVRYEHAPSFHSPGAAGAHNWQPMAFSPKEGLVFIPAQLGQGAYGDDAGWTFTPGIWNTGEGVSRRDPAIAAAIAKETADKSEYGGRLVAWDPVGKRARWIIRGEPHGGALATAGGLVFSGASAMLNAYRAADGEKLWAYPANATVGAGPIAYSLDGVEYIAVMAGNGSLADLGGGGRTRVNGRLLVFRLGGAATAPPYPPAPPVPPLDLARAAAAGGDPAQGEALFEKLCATCHRDGPYLPNLKTSPTILAPDLFKAVVIDGALRPRGMAPFARFMTAADAESIRAYLLQEAHRIAPVPATATAAAAAPGKRKRPRP